MELNDHKRSFWEYITVGTVVGLAMILSMGLYAKRDHLQKSKLMMWELMTFRNRITTHLLEHRRPMELSAELPADPFGNAYQYNSKTGQVSSMTPGYQSW
ncbi:MAG: hypothetical protein Q7T03_01825 [Deltaproteobacteria bacterium]|nr:hypothetical protein [Deltaproteobacteria bacterium]